MSLDVYLRVVQPVDVFCFNITHNLNKMAMEVKLSNGMSLYDVLWRPDEHKGLELARDIADLLSEGYDALIDNPSFYKKWNPENGWGTYEGLLDFVQAYRDACIEYPEATLDISR